MLAAIGLLSVCVWLGKIGRNNKMFYIPMCFMLVVTLVSLIQTIIAKISVVTSGGADIGWAILQAVIAVILIILAFVLALDGVTTLVTERKQ